MSRSYVTGGGAGGGSWCYGAPVLAVYPPCSEVGGGPAYIRDPCELGKTTSRKIWQWRNNAKRAHGAILKVVRQHPVEGSVGHEGRRHGRRHPHGLGSGHGRVTVPSSAGLLQEVTAVADHFEIERST